MIDLAGTIVKSLTIGDTAIKSVWLGSTKVWPSGVVTSAITSVGRYYSSGSAINAAGSNYAYIQGTQIWYSDGVQTSSNNIVLTPSFTQDGVWYKDGDYIKAYSRGTVTGTTRSISVTGTYRGTSYGPFTVQQTANTMTISAGAITSFALNGNSARTQTIGYSATTLYVSSLSGYRRAVYSSGAETQASANLALRKNDDNTWATINGTSSITIPANTGATSRSVTITAYDMGYYPSVSSSITITQSADVDWELTVPSTKSINYSDTAFTITGITSTVGGVAYPITSSMVSISPNRSNISLQSITDYGGGTYGLSLTCDANSAAETLWSYVTITQNGGLSKTCRVSQSANLESISGITVYTGNGDWVLGTITVGSATTVGGSTAYYIRAIVVAKTTPVTGTATVSIPQFAWQWKPPMTGETPYSYIETGLTQTIEAGSTLTLRPDGFDDAKTYYGAYLVTQNGGQSVPRPDQQINYQSGFSVTET